MKSNVMGMLCAAVDTHGSANAGGRHGCLQKSLLLKGAVYDEI